MVTLFEMLDLTPNNYFRIAMPEIRICVASFSKVYDMLKQIIF